MPRTSKFKALRASEESYHIYLASDAAGTGRSRLGNESGRRSRSLKPKPGVPSGTSQYDVAADTSTNLGGTVATHFVVYQERL